MSIWLIAPRDPLIFGDGKSYSSVPGERSQSMPFPFPATIAGAVRTLAGTDLATGKFDKNQLDEVKKNAVKGPILAEINEMDESHRWLFPAPADALIVERGIEYHRYLLEPGILPSGSMNDLGNSTLIFPRKPIRNKKTLQAPGFWYWDQLQKWLECAQDGVIDLASLGIQRLEREVRTHVRISSDTQTAEEGMLFETSGMEFVRTERDEKNRLKSIYSLFMAVQTDAKFPEGFGHLGGERRVVYWKKSKDSLPECPQAIKQKIIEQKHCRLLMVTPAFFIEGYLPTYLRTAFGMKISVQNVACSRYQTISGWDYEKHQPKPTRRLVPAGAVYFLELEGSDVEIEKFVDDIWLAPISDDEQARRDGFGLALLGTWNGQLNEVKI